MLSIALLFSYFTAEKIVQNYTSLITQQANRTKQEAAQTLEARIVEEIKEIIDEGVVVPYSMYNKVKKTKKQIKMSDIIKEQHLKHDLFSLPPWLGLKIAKIKPKVEADIPLAYPFDETTKYWISSHFGYRKIDGKLKYIYGGSGKKFHCGIDIAARLYAPVISPIDGRIIRIGKTKGYGYFVDIYTNQDEIEIIVRLAHLTFGTRKGKHVVYLHIRKGQEVKKGDVIGYVGLTGKTTGPHVHYEVHAKKKGEKYWKLVNPEEGKRINNKIVGKLSRTQPNADELFELIKKYRIAHSCE